MLGESYMTDWEVNVVRRVYASGALFSFVGSLLIILSFIFVKRLRTMTTFLVFMLATSCLGVAVFDSLSWLIYGQMVAGATFDISPEGAETLCRIQAGGTCF
jgi:hypothetical protein